jgi:hypothetical protein
MPNTDYIELVQEQTLSKRVSKEIYGYSIRVKSSAVVYNYSFSGIIVVIGYSYLCAILLKNLLRIFLPHQKQMAQQADSSLDVNAHIKSE